MVFGLDGVLYESDVSVPGAAEAVTWFQECGIPHLFLTNTRQALADDTVAVVDCLVESSENMKLTEKLGQLQVRI